MNHLLVSSKEYCSTAGMGILYNKNYYDHRIISRYIYSACRR